MREYKKLISTYKDYSYINGRIRNGRIREDITIALRVGCGLAFTDAPAVVGFHPSHMAKIAARYREYLKGGTRVREMLEVIGKEDVFTLAATPIGTVDYLKACKKIALRVTGATEEEFMSNKRHRHIVKARQLLWWAIKDCGLPSRVIEEHSPRDSSTARMFYSKMEWEMNAPDYRDEVEMFNFCRSILDYEHNRDSVNEAAEDRPNGASQE